MKLYPDKLPKDFIIYNSKEFDIRSKRSAMADYLNNYHNNSNYKPKSKKYRPITDDTLIKRKKCKEDTKITNRNVHYYNIRASFDIETTSMMVDGEKKAHMYCWQFCIDGVVYFGRSLRDLSEFFKQLIEQLGLNQILRLPIYVHNLGYEFQFIRTILNKDMVVFADDKRKPLSINTTDGFEFRCSYRLTGLSLRKVAKNLPEEYNWLKKTDGLDYKKIRHEYTPMTSEELEYCMNDVLIMDAYIKCNIQESSEYDLSTIPLTSTGFVRKYCRKNCLKGSLAPTYIKLMDRLKIQSASEFKILKCAYQGGFTHANAHYVGDVIEDVYSIDFTSSYPTVMISEKYPMSVGRRINNPDFDKIPEYRCTNGVENCCIFIIEFTNLRLKDTSPDCPISFSKCNGKPVDYILSDTDVLHSYYPENNGRLYSARKCEVVVTDVDYDTIVDYYNFDSAKLKGGLIYKANYLPSPLVECVLSLYNDKTKLKGVEGMEQEYLVSKGMLNSCYGMAVTNFVKNDIDFTEGQWTSKLPNIDECVSTYNDDRQRFLFYPWGVWIRAYARRNLLKSMLEFGDDYIYADTDSIKFKNKDKHMNFINWYNKDIDKKLKKAIQHHKKFYFDFKFSYKDTKPLTKNGISKPLGVWDDDGHYLRFKTLGAKRYVYETDNNTFGITIAGLPKKAGAKEILKQCDNNIDKCFNFFNDNMTLENLKLGSVFIDEPQTYLCTDYLGYTTEITSPSAIHLGDVTFTLSLMNSYKLYIQLLREKFKDRS